MSNHPLLLPPPPPPPSSPPPPVPPHASPSPPPPPPNAVNEEIANLSVYPNPAKNTLAIDGNYTSATIYDLFGKLVLTTDYKNTIDVSALSNGIYFIKVDNTTIKFIKQ